MAGALLSAIVKQLGPFVSSEFALTASVDKEVQKLETKFRTIQAVLNDAEKRQLKEEAVKLWLDKLKRVSYEMDDVLDEWNTAMIKEEIEKQQKEVEDADAETSTTKKRKLEEWEEWIGIGGKEDADCITVMPRLQRLEIHGCGKLKSLPDFLRTIPLYKLEIAGCPIIKERCQRETGEDWRTISHIPIINLQEHSYYLRSR